MKGPCGTSTTTSPKKCSDDKLSRVSATALSAIGSCPVIAKQPTPSLARLPVPEPGDAVAMLTVEHDLVFVKVVAELIGDLVEPLFDDFVLEFGNPPTLHADDVVVVVASVELEHSLATIEMVSGNQTGRFELGQHAVDSGETDIVAALEQRPIDILCGQVVWISLLENLEYVLSRQRQFQSGALEVLAQGAGLDRRQPGHLVVPEDPRVPRL